MSAAISMHRAKFFRSVDTASESAALIRGEDRGLQSVELVGTFRALRAASIPGEWPIESCRRLPLHPESGTAITACTAPPAVRLGTTAR